MAKIIQYPTDDNPTVDDYVAIHDNFTGARKKVALAKYIGYNYEEQTATASQTVFNLTQFTYTPNANNIVVYINGVRQAQSAYTETDSDTITFTSGLTVSDNVQFISAEFFNRSNTTASAISITDAAANFASSDVEGALAELGDSLIAITATVDNNDLTGAPSASSSTTFDSIISSVVVLPTNSGAVRLHSLGDCLIEFGDASVNLDTPLYMPAGTETFGIPTGATHIAVKGVGYNGLLSMTGLNSTYKYQLTTNVVMPVQGGSSNIALPTGTSVRIFSMTDCFLEFGTSSVVAEDTSMFFEAGTEIMRIPTGATHVAAKRYALNGGLYISGVN